MKSVTGKNVLILAGSLFFLFLLISAVRIGTADLLSKYIKNEIETEQINGILLEKSEIEHISHLISFARIISPDDPDHLEDQVHLALMVAALSAVSAKERVDQLAYAAEQVHMAIRLRPASAYNWASLLLMKREQVTYDDEFRLALERTVKLGPWEAEVQSIVADVGLSAWAVLPLAEQEMVRENFLRGMKHQPEVMISIAQSHQNKCTGAQAEINLGCTQ